MKTVLEATLMVKILKVLEYGSKSTMAIYRQLNSNSGFRNHHSFYRQLNFCLKHRLIELQGIEKKWGIPTKTYRLTESGHQPFKNREHVKAEIRRCALAGEIFQLIGILCAVLGIISDALNVTLVLEPMSWFLLAIFASVCAMGPTLHVVLAKHVLGIETESKK